MKTKSQNDQILSHLKRGWKISPIQALEKYGCFRLASRINELRNHGYKINTRKVSHNGKTYAEYQLA